LLVPPSAAAAAVAIGSRGGAKRVRKGRFSSFRACEPGTARSFRRDACLPTAGSDNNSCWGTRQEAGASRYGDLMTRKHPTGPQPQIVIGECVVLRIPVARRATTPKPATTTYSPCLPGKPSPPLGSSCFPPGREEPLDTTDPGGPAQLLQLAGAQRDSIHCQIGNLPPGYTPEDRGSKSDGCATSLYLLHFLATSRGDWLLLLLLLLLEWAGRARQPPPLKLACRNSQSVFAATRLFSLVLALRRSLILYNIGRSILSSPAPSMVMGRRQVGPRSNEPTSTRRIVGC
jgi:hypothetical protein